MNNLCQLPATVLFQNKYGKKTEGELGNRPFILPIVMFSMAVLGSLLLIMYTAPLTTLISSLSLDHHLCADDTQRFFYFHPLNFDSSISHLQNAVQQISSWMTANLLTVNSSKIEFFLIRLINQLAKIHNFLLTPPTLLKILALSWLYLF